MKRLTQFVITALLALLPCGAYGQGFELPCTTGATPLLSPTYNQTTGLLRAWVCVDATGHVSSPVFVAGGGSIGPNTGSAGAVAFYAAAGGSQAVTANPRLTDDGANLTYTGVTGVTISGANASLNLTANGAMSINDTCGADPSGVALAGKLWCSTSSGNRWVMNNNNGGKTNVVQSGVDINTSDQVISTHFGTNTATQYGLWFLSTTLPTTAAATQSLGGVETTTTCIQWFLPWQATITKATITVNTLSAGTTTVLIGIYNVAGSTLLGQFNFDGTTTGTKTSNLVAGGSVVLPPASYLGCWSIVGETVANTIRINIIGASAGSAIPLTNTIINNAGTARAGTAANNPTGTTMPATTGTITAATTGNPPLVFIEP